MTIPDKTTLTVSITKSSIVFTVVFLLGLFILFLLRDLLMLIFLAIIFTSALNPLVSYMYKKRIPRSLSILVAYLGFVFVVLGLFSVILPPLVGETINLISRLNLPQLTRILNLSFLQQTLQDYNALLSNVGSSVPSVINVIFSTFSGVLTIFTFFVLTYYMLSERQRLHKYLLWMFPEKDAENRAEKFVEKLEIELGGWVRGELTLMSVIGLFTYVGLVLLGIPYALPLAIMAGLLEAVPNIGPTVSAIPAVLLAFFTLSPAMGFVVILFYILVQQLENNILVPKIMSSSVNVSPLVAIIVLIAGVKLGGVAGAILSIPTFIFARTIIETVFDGKNPLLNMTRED